QVPIVLGLEKRPDTVANRWSEILEAGDESPQPLTQGTKVIDIFDQMGEGRTLLILGEPGAGKTTTLLELTRDLIARAEQDIDHLIPVVFNLSSWANKRQKIADWLVEELYTRYDRPKKIGQAWVTQQQLLPLLDGLDEVKVEYREECIAALNQFKQDYGAELAVCSRIRDYEALSNRLNFQSAVYLTSLTLEQICHYLDSVGADLTGLRALIKEDVVLQELAQSPLMLNIMTLAYQGVAVEDLPKTEVVEERRRQLFDDYIEKMFKRPNRSKNKQKYSKSQTKHWLSWLAQRMVQESQTVFLIGKMQPHWLDKRHELIYWLIGVLPFWLIFGLFFALSGELLGALIIGLIFGLIELSQEINNPEIEIEIKTSPNQGIWESLQNAVIVGLSVGLSVGLIVGLNKGFREGLMAGLIGVLLGGLKPGGRVCIQHFTLRLILYFNNYIPWNYNRFLDYAAERIFLQKVGGGYIFIHRLLMEHFAQMEHER
ncbi:MAG: NACHT domain-containing protein, partial [Coleofasciculus sp. Co-bin14]|nr:NACHT domain-containing protein [Coleofasciculus sp. Co-bin14]